MQDLNIVIVQSKQFWEDKSANLSHFEKHLEGIEPGSTDLVLLPEMFNTGFSMNTEALAEEMNGDGINWLKNQAEKLDALIGATLIIKEDNNYFNRLVIVSKTKVESYYNKRHLFRMAGENDHFKAGDERVVFEHKGWKLFLQVCYDLRFPVFSRNRTINGKKEYDALIYLANWPEKRVYAWKNLLQARAIENQAYCIGVNRVGEDGNGITYSGDSMMIDPWGKIEVLCLESKEIVKFLTLKRSVMNDIEQGFPAFKDAD